MLNCIEHRPATCTRFRVQEEYPAYFVRSLPGTGLLEAAPCREDLRTEGLAALVRAVSTLTRVATDAANSSSSPGNDPSSTGTCRQISKREP